MMINGLTVEEINSSASVIGLSRDFPSSVSMYTDGACLKNPGQGGYAAILRFGNLEIEVYGSAPHTTNNQMELMGPIAGLRALKRPCRVTIYSDSQYVCKGFNSWMHGWERNGWMTSAKKPVLNPELWKELLEMSKIHRIKFEWVKGHSGHVLNERADRLAVLARNMQSNGKTVPTSITL